MTWLPEQNSAHLVDAWLCAVVDSDIQLALCWKKHELHARTELHDTEHLLGQVRVGDGL